MSDEKFPPGPSIYMCENCDVICSKLSDWNRHLTTNKHKKNAGTEETEEKVSADFACTNCEYTCNKKSLWSKHILTSKHKKLSMENDTTGYACKICNKVYTCYSSLWSHKQKCKENTPITENITMNIIEDHPVIRNFIVEQTKLYVANVNAENQELRNFIIEQSKQHAATINDIVEKNAEALNKVVQTCKITTINNTQNNTQSNKFNINVYLNETCKDAINFSEFLENIEVSYQDLENNVQLGFVNGIAKIFTDNLKQLELHQRPIHCTDVKREVVYIKDNNVWTKQLNTDKLNYAVNVISSKGIKKLMMWKRENPEYQDVNSDFSNKCIDIQRATMAGYNRHVYNPKVIHVIARETAIRK